MLFKRNVCFSNLKHPPSSELPLTARKTVFSNLKVNEVPVLVSVPLQITVPVPISVLFRIPVFGFSGRTESFDCTHARHTVKPLLICPLSVADPGEGPGGPPPPPPYLRVWMTNPPPSLSEGLDPPLPINRSPIKNNNNNNISFICMTITM